MKNTLIVMAAFFLLAGAAAAKTVNIEYILDASGSMHELIGDQQKIDIARKTLIDLVSRLPRDKTEIKLNVGLRVYGHSTRQEEDTKLRCRDSVLEVPIAGVETAAGEQIIQVGNTWNPVLVPAGVYELWYRQTEHHNNEVRLADKLEIKKGKVTEFDVNSGVALIPSNPEEKAPYNWILKPMDGKNSEVGVRYDWGPVPAAPGDYSFSIRQTEHGHSLMELIPKFTIEKGQLVELEL